METNFICWALAQGSFIYKHYYTQRDLAAYASSLWVRVNDEYKLHWKMLAKFFNQLDGRTGHRKRTGFWHFAKALEGLVKDFSAQPFLYDVFMHLTSEARQQFYIPGAGTDMIDLS